MKYPNYYNSVGSDLSKRPEHSLLFICADFKCKCTDRYTKMKMSLNNIGVQPQDISTDLDIPNEEEAVTFTVTKYTI